MTTTVTDRAAVHAIVEEIRAEGTFALDLEFVSESRYVPELCLVQVGWGDPEAPQVAAVDTHEAPVEPLFELVEDAAVETVLHSAQADLALLGGRFGVTGRGVVDTQIAAAFLGLGDQVGYGNLVEQLTGVSLDKGAQFTDWCRRPLSDEQLRYALDDVRYLPRLWQAMRRRLEELGRLAWVEEESARLAADWAQRTPPEELYRRVRGWERLDEAGRAAVRELAAWREREALAANKPPQWLLKDASLVEVARRRPTSAGELRSIRGVSPDTARRHGDAILAAAARRELPVPEAPPRHRTLPGRAKGWGPLVLGLIHARCREADVAPRFVASRADADALVHWFHETGGEAPEPDLPLLSGWRRELAGQAALDWLAGQTAIAADPDSESGLRLVEPGPA
jgi:ribonuclease D